MKIPSSLLHSLTLAIAAILLPGSLDAAETKPIKALLVCGGCCHDYERQKKILTEGISQRANVEWTVVHDGGDKRESMIPLYNSPDWAKGYDVALHNECFGAVTDVAFVERIAKAHYDGVPAVMLHCSTHSYRAAKTDEWRKLIGQTSMSHEKNRDLEVKVLSPSTP